MINLEQTILSLLLGGGVGAAIFKALVHKETGEEIDKRLADFKTSVKEEIKELKNDIDKLHQRANKMEDEFVTCKFCTMQHDNLTTTLTSMDKKLDTLIEKI